MNEARYLFTVCPSRAAVDKDLSHAEYRMLAVICSFIDKDNQCWPSYNRLAETMGCSRRHVIGLCEALKAKDYIDIQERLHENGTRSSNVMCVKFHQGSEAELHQGGETELHQGGETELHHHIIELHQKNYTNELSCDLLGGEESVERCFDVFWEAYPKGADGRKPKKPLAKRKYMALLRAKRVSHDRLLLAAQHYAKTREVKEGYVSHCVTWLNQQRWLEFEALEDDTEKMVLEARLPDTDCTTREGKALHVMLDYLLQKVGIAKFNSWFAKLRIARFQGVMATLSAPSAFVAEYVKTHHDELLLEALRQTEPGIEEYRLLVDGIGELRN